MLHFLLWNQLVLVIISIKAAPSRDLAYSVYKTTLCLLCSEDVGQRTERYEVPNLLSKQFMSNGRQSCTSHDQIWRDQSVRSEAVHRTTGQKFPEASRSFVGLTNATELQN